jgi:glycosyltransferase involved in cell wall biosynthesis
VTKIPGKDLWIHRTDFGPKNVFCSAGAVDGALRLAKQIAPDVVHGQHLAGANVAVRLKAALNLPTVVTIHKTPRFDLGNGLVERDPVYAEIRFLASTGLCDHFVAGSRAFLEELLRVSAGRVDSKTVRLIYHGVSYRWLRSRAFRADLSPAVGLHLRSGEKLVICPARIDTRKNLPAFVAAAAGLAKALPQHRWRFLITGQPQDAEEQEHCQELQAQADHLGIGELLSFQSFNFYQLPAVFRRATACVLPSYKEGLGLVLLEALALGVPVVACKTKGIDEVIEHSEEGALLFEIGEQRELLAQLMRIASEPGLAERLRRVGYRLVRQRFAGDRMARDHVKLYEELVAARRKASRPNLTLA